VDHRFAGRHRRRIRLLGACARADGQVVDRPALAVYASIARRIER